MYRVKIVSTSPVDMGGYFRKKFFFKAAAKRFAQKAWELDPAGAFFIVEKIKMIKRR
jgi:hypothetical protein